MLESIITSKTRLNLLIKFFINIANRSYLNLLANELGESTNSVRKELNNLTSAGYLKRQENKKTELMIKMNIFFMIVNKDNNYSITYENTKVNFEKMIILIIDFLNSKHLKINDV